MAAARHAQGVAGVCGVAGSCSSPWRSGAVVTGCTGRSKPCRATRLTNQSINQLLNDLIMQSTHWMTIPPTNQSIRDTDWPMRSVTDARPIVYMAGRMKASSPPWPVLGLMAGRLLGQRPTLRMSLGPSVRPSRSVLGVTRRRSPRARGSPPAAAGQTGRGAEGETPRGRCCGHPHGAGFIPGRRCRRRGVRLAAGGLGSSSRPPPSQHPWRPSAS